MTMKSEYVKLFAALLCRDAADSTEKHQCGYQGGYAAAPFQITRIRTGQERR